MKSFRRAFTGGAAVLCAGVVLHAGLAEWVQNLAVETGLRSVFFRQMQLPYGTIDGRRPPRETRPALGARIAAAPKEAMLYRLRAGEAELALDFPAAEADWKQYAALSGDRMALADYYHRRLQTAEELTTLDEVATAEAFERAVTLAQDQGLPDTAVMAQYRAWIGKFPEDSELRKRFIRYLTDRGQFTAADRELHTYRQVFPEDDSTWVEEVGLTMRRGTVNQAIAVFDKAFRPLMAENWLKGYFDLLAGQGRLRDFLAKARAAAAADPESLDPVARQFYYYQNEKNMGGSARRVLLEYLARKKTWKPDELYDTAKLLESVQEWDQAARQYYALYSLPAADDAARERGLSGIAHVLLSAPDQPVRFGAGDLSLYKDIGRMDPHPGFLNGILSLVLNSSWPAGEYDSENQKSVAYFHRAQASRLLDLLDTRFPHAQEAPALHAELIDAFATYGDDDGVVRAGRKFLAAYPQSPEHVGVALAMAGAFERQSRIADETAVYDSLLKELGAVTPQPPEYAQVLDRYIARLVALNRTTDALELYRREIDRNPQDAGLYEKLAAFLDARNMGAQVEQVYKEAAAKFPDRSWQDKLARWYLRRRRNQDFAELTRQVAGIFSGTELEKYFREIVNPASLDAALYRQVNLYAHERFPDNLTFVKNLLNAYVRPETADPAAHAQLLRSYWFYDAQLRSQFFEGMARAGTLDGALAAARTPDARSNPAAAQFVAEGEAWRCHFETAAPLLRTLAGDFPGDSSVVLRAATVERSLGRTETAVALDRNLAEAEPRNRDALARIGDTLADRDLLTRARPYWNRMAEVAPGKPEGYLEAATIFWDYYRYDDALRLIGEARARLKQPALYAYEAGAIYEGKRDFAAAVRQYQRDDKKDSPAEKRLLALAANPKYRAVVDAATAKAPLDLRAEVLEAEKRTSDLEALLKAHAATETSASMLEFIEDTAARWGFAAVQEAAAARQVAISHDPIDQMRLRLALMRLQEAHGEIAAARLTVEGVLRDDPASLGVVRAATDFYWRNKMSDPAIATLTAAAGRSNAVYRGQFTFEAARKSTEARQFTEARRLLEPLLAADPFNSKYLAAMADTYAAASDDAGLRDFYVASIDAMKQAPLAVDERNTRIAGLRRGLIPALTRLGRFSDAVDQYIELINRYPEDQGLIHEAATYSARNNLASRLTAYYAKASADSPKDYRWPMVTGRLQTNLENFDAAIAAYSSAIKVRPDRSDLYGDRGTLEERLMRFSDAEKTYGALWELSYHDAAWLDKVAELEARQQKPDAAVATLRKAYLEGRPERTDLLLDIAQKLEGWNLIPQALEFARRAGSGDLQKQDMATYARVMTRARQYEDVLAKLSNDREAMAAMAEMVARYYAPEEKAAFAASLEKRLTATPGSFRIDIARQAELFDLEAQWLQAETAPRGPYGGPQYELIQLQQSRLRFDDLGRQLELLAARAPQGPVRVQLLTQAAEAFTSADDTPALERIFGQVPETRRYLEIVGRGDPAKLLQWAGQRDDAADLAVASGNPAVALQAVAARGAARPPVWTRAYDALTSLYYWNAVPDASASFRQFLGAGTIGERLGKPVDHNQQLAGSVWFYYGARFGAYLELQQRPEAEDYLPAELEENPGRPDAYSTLADWYVERGEAARAFTEYGHAIELAPDRGEFHDRIAVLYWDQGRHDEAVAQWKLAVADFEAQQGRPNLANSFWPQATAALEHIGAHGVVTELRPAVDSLLRHYVERHNQYRLEPLLVPVAKYRLVDFNTQPMDVLQPLTWSGGRQLLTPQDRIVVLRRLIYLGEQQTPGRSMYGEEQWREELAGLLLDSGDLTGARAVLAAIPESQRGEPWRGGSLLVLEIRIAAKGGELAALLDSYRRNPKEAPPLGALQNAAQQLASRHEDAAADQVLAFAYSRELDNSHFDASNFLGLAEIRLKAGDPAGAQQLLRRMQLVSYEPFAELLPAADVLEKYGHKAEAAEYIQARARAVPWDAQAKLRLGADLGAIVADPHAPYAVRVEAAKLGAQGGEGELALLARGHISAAEANRPFYYDARLTAARSTTDPAARMALLLDAVAVQPERQGPLLPLFQAAYRAGRLELALEAARRSRWVPWPGTLEEARELAGAYRQASDFMMARRMLEEAAKVQTSATIRTELTQEIAAIDRQAQLRQENEARRPHVSASVEQGTVVRPRIEK